tara:strand:- start:375 stop:572 length:198 start_codon:yes stop_codon:yes gene_type:complete
MALLQLNSKATALETKVGNNEADYIRAVFEQIMSFAEQNALEQNRKIIELEAKVQTLERTIKLQG